MDVFEVLGERARRRVVEVLADGEAPAGRLVEVLGAELGLSQPAVSRHLRVLREAGVVVVRPEGTLRVYALAPQGLRAAHEWLTRVAPAPSLAAVWQQRLDALGTEVVRQAGAEPRRPRTAARRGA